MYMIELGQEPNPFPGADPTEHFQCFVGLGARVMHPAFALAFRDRDHAKRIAARFPLARILRIGELLIIREEMVAMMACPTPVEFMRWMGSSEAERKATFAGWVRALHMPDDRCPAGRGIAQVRDLPVRDHDVNGGHYAGA